MKGIPLYLIWAVAIVGQVASFALLISGLLKLLSLLIPRARLRVGRIAKVIALVSISVLAPILFSVFLFILLSLSAAIPSDVIQSTAVAAITLAMTVTITWLFFRLLPTQDTPEPPSYSTWTKFRERFIDLASMEPPLRLLTALAIAQLLASAILLVVSHLWPHARPLAVATYQGQSVHLDPRVFKATLGYLLIAWPLVLVGASPGRLTFPLILVLFTLTTLPWKELSHHVPVLISLATIATVWSWALFTWRKHTRSSELPSTPRLRRLILNLLFLASVLGIHYSFLKAFLPPAGLGSLPSLVTEQIFNLSLLLVPILFLTGKDCAELSELGAHFTLAVVGRTLSRPLLPILALLVGGGILYWSIQTFQVPLSAYAEFLNYFTPLTVAVVSALSFLVFSILTHLLYRFAQRQPLLLRIPLFSVVTIIGFVALVSAIFMLLASLTYGVVIVALGLAAVLALRALAKASALHQWRSAHVPFVAILLTAVFLTGAHELATLWQARAPQLPHHPTELTFAVAQCSGHSAQLSATASPECSFSYPQDWQWCFLPDSRTFEFREVASGQSPCDESQSTRALFLLGVRNLSELEPFSSPSSTAEDLARRIWPFLPQNDHTRYWDSETTIRKRSTWSTAQFTAHGGAGRLHVWIWARSADRLMWVLAGIAPDDDRAYYDSLYGRMVASWRPDRSASALPPIVYSDLKSTALRVSAFGLVPVLLAPVGLALLFLPRMSSSKPRVVIWLRQIFLRSSELLPSAPRLAGNPRDIAGFFVLVVAIVAFFFLPHGDLTELFGRTQAPHVASTNPGSHDSLPLTSAPTAQALKALQVFVSGATVLVATLFLVRGMTGIRSHLLVELLQLNIALLFLGGFLWFYSRLSLAGEKTVWAQAALLVILKVWDLLISGKDVTNVNGRVFQRRFLLLLYLGYIMFVSTAILHFSSQQLADTTLGIDRFFEAETLLRQGILWLGSPLLLVGFFFRIRRLMSPTRYLDDAVSNQSSA